MLCQKQCHHNSKILYVVQITPEYFCPISFKWKHSKITGNSGTLTNSLFLSKYGINIFLLIRESWKFTQILIIKFSLSFTKSTLGLYHHKEIIDRNLTFLNQLLFFYLFLVDGFRFIANSIKMYSKV